MPLMQLISHSLVKLVAWFRRDLVCVDVHDEEPPDKIARRRLIRMIDENQPWAVVMMCPCGCGEVIELSLSPASKTHWKLTLEGGRPTLHPSVWRNIGCQSHFWVRRGRVHWVP